MQYLLLIYSEEEKDAAWSDEERGRIMQAYFKYTEELKSANAFVAGEALQPTGTATTVQVRGSDSMTTDGPFAETKEQLGGFYMIECENLDAALEWARKCPASEHGSVEVRPTMVFD